MTNLICTENYVQTDYPLKRILPEAALKCFSDPDSELMPPGDYPHICANCGGWGVILIRVWNPKGDFQANKAWRESEKSWVRHKLLTFSCPVCCDGQARDFLHANCGLTGDDFNIRLKDFRVVGKMVAKETALLQAQKLVEMVFSAAGFVTFWGSFGVGKTHLLKAIVNEFISLGINARYVTLSELLGSIGENYGRPNGNAVIEDLLRVFQGIKVLCIDEIDKVKLTDNKKELIFRLLDARYNGRSRLLTVMATNIFPEKLPEDLGYLASRMIGGGAIEVGGPDVRPAQGLRERKQMETRN